MCDFGSKYGASFSFLKLVLFFNYKFYNYPLSLMERYFRFRKAFRSFPNFSKQVLLMKFYLFKIKVISILGYYLKFNLRKLSKIFLII